MKLKCIEVAPLSRSSVTKRHVYTAYIIGQLERKSSSLTFLISQLYESSNDFDISHVPYIHLDEHSNLQC
jgi:hypothetical protein